MRPSRTLTFVAPLVVAAILSPQLAATAGAEPAGAFSSSAAAIGFGPTGGGDCDDLADAADNAWQDYRAAARTADAVAAVYGYLSPQHLAAVVYREIKENSWESARDAWAECHYAA